MKTDEILQLPKINQPVVAPEEPEETLDLGRLLRSLIRNWWIIVGITVATTAAAGLKVLNDTPEYVGKFEFLVQPGSAETEVISNIPETFSNDERPTRSAVTVDEDLLRILKSPTVLMPVIEQVQSSYPSLCEVPEEIAVSTSTSATDFCYQSISSQLSVDALEDALDENSTIVQAVFQNPDPQAVQFVLDKLSQAYLDYSLETKQADIRRGLEFVEQKLPDLGKRVNTLQTRLQDLRLQNDIIDPVSRATQLAEQIGSFSQEQLELEVQLKQTRSVADDLKQQLVQSRGQAASSALTQNPRYQTLLNSLLELDAQIAEDSTLYLDTAPDMEVLEEQRRNLLALLASEGEQSQREVINQIGELEAREQALQQTLQGLSTDVGQLTGVARNYDEIQRELQISTENLNQFIAKREALEIDAAQREIPWQLVTPPTPPQAVTTDLLRYLLLGGTLGLLLGVGVALLVDESSGVIHSEDDLKRSTRLPVLGSIPAYSVSQELSLERSAVAARQYVGANIRADRNGFGSNAELGENPLSSGYANDPFAESFRSLFTNLRLLNSPNLTRSIAVSSVMPGEGKSTVALHLAEAAAAMGQRVLLIDADLRNPQIHNYLELSNEKGLTNLFSGESNPALIQKFLPEPNLYVIAAGSAPFEPARLFSSRSMKRFTEKVRAKFDLVIYDTPPLLGQSDAYLVASNTDGLLLVTQPGKLKQQLLDRAMEQLRIADINVLGMVTREG
ncbi:polysaccharide biosynthesis tyrosine autokinase [Leptolyngbya sp. BC1307]|uniref:GumC family protein n=1 Tax=Leptolyngbya sp. BC1307 TaxID=2029589 RepID=UPI000EFD45F7|nr:polysaccharide biosynthesis tyrosine autokinase [Leptolyngbya sp. BC1307]